MDCLGSEARGRMHLIRGGHRQRAAAGSSEAEWSLRFCKPWNIDCRATTIPFAAHLDRRVSGNDAIACFVVNFTCTYHFTSRPGRRAPGNRFGRFLTRETFRTGDSRFHRPAEPQLVPYDLFCAYHSRGHDVPGAGCL